MKMLRVIRAGTSLAGQSQNAFQFSDWAGHSALSLSGEEYFELFSDIPRVIKMSSVEEIYFKEPINE